MALADPQRQPAPKGADGKAKSDAALNKTPDRTGTTGESAASERQSEGERGYGRQGGSIADTGTRTDVPVGVEQVESSALTKSSPRQDSERQGDPPPSHRDPDSY